MNGRWPGLRKPGPSGRSTGIRLEEFQVRNQDFSPGTIPSRLEEKHQNVSGTVDSNYFGGVGGPVSGFRSGFLVLSNHTSRVFSIMRWNARRFCKNR